MQSKHLAALDGVLYGDDPKQGVIDGTMSVSAVYVNLKFNDIGKTLTEVNDTMVVSVATASVAASR